MNARPRRGFTAVELLTTCVLAAVLATLAWPSLRQHWQRVGRAEAVRSLMQLQAAQEQHREMFGVYAGQLAQLAHLDTQASAGTTPHGRYAIALELTGAESYQARASARREGPQHDDHACPALTLTVVQGFASHGPDGRCWNR